MGEYVVAGRLRVAEELYDFIKDEVLPGLDIDPEQFWTSFDEIVHDLTPDNQALLDRREALQNQIDEWLRTQAGQIDAESYKRFLRDIGYLVPPGPDFVIETKNVDSEISNIAGPQLVVPVMNARYALNAANARWGSLYDALYGTDAIAEDSGAARGGGYNPVRGQKVIEWARDFLDQAVPIDGSWHDVEDISINGSSLHIAMDDGAQADLKDPSQFVGFNNAPHEIYFQHNGLHIKILIDADHPVGEGDRAHIADVILESAMTVIMDCEDSVAAVDAEDKVVVYRNWLGLMKGDLSEEMSKAGKSFTRVLNDDLAFTGVDGQKKSLSGRAVMLVRNVGHLMRNPAIVTEDGREVFEGLMDAMITVLIAMHDVGPDGRHMNSPAGSIYVVKPKMHGPEEVAFAVQTFDRVEKALGLAPNTVKIGIMDEERRTTVNLKACIHAARNRVMFINTGFLDRTGDEIHTSMEAGPMLRKGDMKGAAWIKAYEEWNVDVGLACGFTGRAQIGKGMWAMPDRMADMLNEKIAHPNAGANTAWVPSPTAATLHAVHYHRVNVGQVQTRLAQRESASLDDILSVPLAHGPNWTDADIDQELRNNAQGILGYVVRWVEHGVGCSKVPDIHNVGLMEDRATLRISSQHIANWLHHGVVSKQQVRSALEDMAHVVDEQNSNDPAYCAMADDFDNSIAFQAACDLVFEGRAQPSGYTEPLLHARRRAFKAKSLN